MMRTDPAGSDGMMMMNDDQQKENSENVRFGGSYSARIFASKTRAAPPMGSGSADRGASASLVSAAAGQRGHPALLCEGVPAGEDAGLTGVGEVRRMSAPTSSSLSSSSSSSSMRRKSTAVHGGGGAPAMSELSRIPEGENSEEQSTLRSVSSSGQSLSSASPRVSLSGSSYGSEGGGGYAASRAGWLRPRTPGAATASRYTNMETPSTTTLETPGADWRGRGDGDGGGVTGEYADLPNLSQPHGSWGGCSTIKRRGDDAGGRVSGLMRQQGEYGDSVVLDRSRRSSTADDSSLASIGGEVRVGKTPRAGRGQGGVGGRGGGEGAGAGGARSSSGSGSGGRVDYHSLCFSSSSSNTSSPFGLLDGDSPSS